MAINSIYFPAPSRQVSALPLQNAWISSPPNLQMDDNQIHIWCFTLDQAYPDDELLERILSKDEMERARRFTYPEVRQKYVRIHALLHMILAAYLRVEPASLNFSYGANEKPTLIRKSGWPEVEFNLSHSNNLALLAVCLEKPVGIDLELIHPMQDMDRMVERIFTPDEKELFHACPPEARPRCFFDLWCLKEALIKAQGGNLGMIWRRLAIEPPIIPIQFHRDTRSKETTCNRLIQAHNWVMTMPIEAEDLDQDHASNDRHCLYSLQLFPEYAGALAVSTGHA